MKEPDSENSTQLNRRFSEAIDRGVQIGNAILGVETATGRALHKTRRIFGDTKVRFMRTARKARQGVRV